VHIVVTERLKQLHGSSLNRQNVRKRLELEAMSCPAGMAKEHVLTNQQGSSMANLPHEYTVPPF
jgi:hypothetical protein